MMFLLFLQTSVRPDLPTVVHLRVRLASEYVLEFLLHTLQLLVRARRPPGTVSTQLTVTGCLFVM